ncbi:AEC family transporter [Actinomyces oris]
MADVVAGLAVFGAVIAVGWLLVRTRAVPADADGVLTRVCFFAATPALLVTTLSRADLTAVLSRSTTVAVAAELTAIVSAWCLHRLVLRRPTAEATIGALASGYVNAANLGIPVAVLVLGDAATIAPILLLQLLVLTPATFTVLDAVTRRGNPSRLATLTVPLRNPLLWGVVAGTAANLGGVDLKEWGGGYPAQGLEMLGRVAVPLMMLALGMSLAGAPRPLRNPAPDEAAPSPQGSLARTVQSAQSARQAQEPLVAEAGSEAHEINTAGARLPRVEEEPARGARSTSQRGAGRRSGLWLAVGWKLAVMPGLAVVVGLAAGLSGAQLLTPVVTAALPTAQNVFMYASRYGAAKDLARDAVLLTTAGFVPVVLLAAALLH